MQAFDEFPRREIYQNHVVRCAEQGIRNRLVHAHTGNARHNVVQALKMLNVDGRPDIDTVAQQLLDILIATGVTGPPRLR